MFRHITWYEAIPSLEGNIPRGRKKIVKNSASFHMRLNIYKTEKKQLQEKAVETTKQQEEEHAMPSCKASRR
jgi:hypothetical protein